MDSARADDHMSPLAAFTVSQRSHERGDTGEVADTVGDNRYAQLPSMEAS